MQADQKRFDAPGLLLSMIGFTALVYGITEAGSHGWGSAAVVPIGVKLRIVEIGLAPPPGRPQGSPLLYTNGTPSRV